MQQYISRYTCKNGCIKQCGKKDIIYIHEAEDDRLLYKSHKTCTVTLRHILLYEVYGCKTGHIFVYEDLRHEACIDGRDIIYRDNALENCSSASSAAAEIHRARIHEYNIHSAKAQPFSVYAVVYHNRV